MLQLDNYVFKGRYEDVLGTAMIFQHDKGTKFSCQKKLNSILFAIAKQVYIGKLPALRGQGVGDHRVGAIIGPIKYKTLLNGVHLTMHLIHPN